MTRSLWRSPRHEDWHAQWQRYDDAVAAQQNIAKKDGLVALDEWFRVELRAALHDRDPAPFMTQQELKKLMEWKLKKGKWRPQLMKFVTSLSDAEVTAASKAALKVLKNGLSASKTEPKTLALSQLRTSIEALISLKGVGPATASAVLAAYDDAVPFMSDEALEAVAAEIGARKYTLPHYLALAETLQNKADWLNAQAKDSEDPWTPQRVQLCLYAQVFAPMDSESAKTATKTKQATPKPAKRSLDESDQKGQHQDTPAAEEVIEASSEASGLRRSTRRRRLD